MEHRKITQYKQEIYQTIPAQNLIVFSIYSIIKSNEECTFERLVKECFTLFPTKFSFYRYPQWPDSLKLDRQLRTLREKGWITGGAEGTFSLTRFGEKVAKDVEKILLGKRTPPKVAKKLPKGREAKLINQLKEDELFLRFLKDKEKFQISESELRKLLHCTLETPLRIVKQNLQYCKNLAEECGEQELYQFLEISEQQLAIKKRY